MSYSNTNHGTEAPLCDPNLPHDLPVSLSECNQTPTMTSQTRSPPIGLSGGRSQDITTDSMPKHQEDCGTNTGSSGDKAQSPHISHQEVSETHQLKDTNLGEPPVPPVADTMLGSHKDKDPTIEWALPRNSLNGITLRRFIAVSTALRISIFSSSR